MYFSTTSTIAGHEITEHLGIVFGEFQIANFEHPRLFKRDCNEAILEMQKSAEKLSADAIVGIRTHYELSNDEETLWVFVSGTAVKLK